MAAWQVVISTQRASSKQGKHGSRCDTGMVVPVDPTRRMLCAQALASTDECKSRDLVRRVRESKGSTP